MVGEDSFNDVVHIANKCKTLPVEAIKHCESLMEKLRYEYDGVNVDLDNDNSYTDAKQNCDPGSAAFWVAAISLGE